jgi:predicted translin family RNA/ssDNA-binding protein
MENNITENKIIDVLNNIINEEISKVKREEFNRVQFKIDELEQSLNDTVKELRKLNESIPSGLKTISKGRITSINSHLQEANKVLTQLKEKIKKHKKMLYTQNMVEKKS